MHRVIRPIRSQADVDDALREIDRLWDAQPGSEEADSLEVLSILVENYERVNCPIDPPDPIDAIRFRMDQQGLTNKDLENLLGHKSRVSEILNRRRPLSISMIRALHKHLGISAEILLRKS